MPTLPMVAHLTSVHSRYDTRIFHKMCVSCARHQFNVHLVVSDGLGNEVIDKVYIHDIEEKTGSRITRMTKVVWKVFTKAKSLNADIYHLHDPELIPIGIKLKHLGKTVIFDSHEDIPRQILAKPYLDNYLRQIISNLYSIYEQKACKRFDGIVTATPFIRKKFIKINPNTININNFPIIGELKNTSNWKEKKTQVCYIGGISRIRGICEMTKALEITQSNVRLQLAGYFNDPDVEHTIKGEKGWSKIDERGFLDRQGIKTVLDTSIAGLVTLHPTINYMDALPVKMFEYMSAGIPVIASNFPLWQDIIESNNCGLCVDPLNPAAIAEAIDFLAENPDQAHAMGRNGFRAIQELYNWEAEESKLLDFYNSFNSKV